MSSVVTGKYYSPQEKEEDMYLTRLKSFAKSKTFTLLLLNVFVIIVFTIFTGGRFLRPLNIRNILNAMVIVSFLVIGEGLLIIYGNIDLSCGNVGTMCAIVMALVLLNENIPWFAALLISFIVGIIAGLLNATLIVKLNFQPFIATLAMASVAEGLSYVFGNASSIAVENSIITFLGTYRFFNDLIPFSVIISLAFMLIYGIILSRTKFGRMIYLCGGNREAARLTGINPKKICYILFANMGFLSALSGSLLAARMKSATVNGITSNQFSGITAAILGGISFGGGAGGMLGAFFGLLLLNCFNNGMTIMGIDPFWQTVASGILLLVALIFDYISVSRAAKRLA